jgi:TonB family protein
MTEFLIYDLKVAALIAVFYFCYRLLMERETMHRLNRIVLLSSILLSLVLPLCVITLHETVEVEPMRVVDHPEQVIADLETVSTPTEDAVETLDLLQPSVIFVVFMIGFLCRLFYIANSYRQLRRMIKDSEQHPLADGVTLAVVDLPVAPFSWMRTIVLGRTDYEERNPSVLAHERGHIQQHHSWDIVFVEVLTALQWFNPVVWLLRRDLRTVHEYEADASVLSSGSDVGQYIQLLMRKAAGTQACILANGINNSTTKKRIIMMLKHKSNKYNWLKVLYVLPVVAVSLATSARIQKDVVVNLDSSEVTDDVTKPLADDDHLILLIDDMDDLKKVVAEKGKTKKMKANLDFNDHFTQKGMDGKTIIVHLPKGTLYENDKGSKKIETDLDYAFPKGGFEWRLNGSSFDENNIPVLHFMSLKKVENHWNGKRNVVNLVTMNGQQMNEIVAVDKAPVSKVYSESSKLNEYILGLNKETGADGSEKVYDVVEEMPQFPGGQIEMLQYLAKSFQYPEEAEKAGKQGRVIVTFVVEKDGSITNARVVKALDPHLDAEALRVINAMPKWNPGKQNGVAVRCKYTVPVGFHLDG